MWGCTRWPDCRGAINIDPASGATRTAAPEPVRAGVPGAYAQARLERELEQARLKRRALLPLAVALAIVAMTMTFYGAQPLGLLVASIAAVITGALSILLIVRLPFESLFWSKGVAGERKTAAYLEPLLDAGFVVLHNRLLPGVQGDIDHLVIGPTGIFPIETKNWSGRVDVRFDRLFVGDHDRTFVVQQIYREALAVQVALGEELTAHRVTVTPILVALGGVAWFERLVAGVHVTDGKGLAKLLADRPTLFDDDEVQRIARLADQRLRVRYPWQAEA